MNSEDFDHILQEQIQQTSDILGTKAREYATADRLHNFKVAAALKGETPRQALAGMMAKHTVSVYDMCRSDEQFTIAQWEEKIGDHINYLVLLKAVIYEEANEKLAQLPLNLS